jgi:hypothetical protein
MGKTGFWGDGRENAGLQALFLNFVAKQPKAAQRPKHNSCPRIARVLMAAVSARKTSGPRVTGTKPAF